MSLTSYRAAPPRENGKRGIDPARSGCVAIVTRIEKGRVSRRLASSGITRCWMPPECDGLQKRAKPALIRKAGHFHRNFHMNEKPALQPGLAVGEALRAVA